MTFGTLSRHQEGSIYPLALSLPCSSHSDPRGQRIRSDQSHKSYRPFTVISFRLSRLLWQRLPKAWTSKVEGACQLHVNRCLYMTNPTGHRRGY